jgi:hypothetical protein
VKAEGTSQATITIQNRLPAGHRWQAAIDPVFRDALKELPGAWDVSVHPIDRLWFQIVVVAPDGASWSTSTSTQEGLRIEDLAGTIRAACVRRCRMKPAWRRRGVGASVRPPAAPNGTSK